MPTHIATLSAAAFAAGTLIAIPPARAQSSATANPLITAALLVKACSYKPLQLELKRDYDERERTSASRMRSRDNIRMFVDTLAATDKDAANKIFGPLKAASAEAAALDSLCALAPLDSMRRLGLKRYSALWSSLTHIPTIATIKLYADSARILSRNVRAATVNRAQIRFALGKAELDSTDRAQLGSFVALLRDRKALDAPDTIVVTGYADKVGSQRVNDSLSHARAAHVAAYLIDLGVPARRVVTSGVWLSDGAANASEFARLMNRSVEIHSTYHPSDLETVQLGAVLTGNADTRASSQIQRNPSPLVGPPTTEPTKRASSATDIAADLVIDKAKEQMLIWLVSDATGRFCGDSLRIAAVNAFINERSAAIADARKDGQQIPMKRVERLAELRTAARSAMKLVAMEQLELPATCQLFRKIENGDYVPSLTTLRAIVKQDLRQVPEQLARRALAARLTDEQVRESALIVLFTLQAVHDVDGGKGIDEVIASYPAVRTALGVADASLGKADDAMRRYADYARQFDNASSELSLDTHVRPSTDSLAVVALKVLAINGGNALEAVHVASILETVKDLESVRTIVQALRVSLATPATDAADQRSARVKQYAQLVANVTDLTTSILRHDPALANMSRYARLWRMLDVTHTLALAIATEEYHDILYSLASLRESLSSSVPPAEIHPVASNGVVVATRRLAGTEQTAGPSHNPVEDMRAELEVAVRAKATSTDSPDGVDDLNDRRMRTLVLFTDIMQAQTEGDVQAALGRYDTGHWGYREKRRGGFYSSINGYLGGASGIDAARGIKGSVYAKPFVPLGLEVGYGAKNGYSHSVLLNVLDVGAIAVSHVTETPLDDTKDKYARMPVLGVFYMLGLRNMPLSVGVGGQLTNVARAEGGGTVTVGRFGFVAGIDAPLMHIHW